MALQSMTGFARAEGEYGNSHWAWELKSVNGRNLDFRCRLPSSMEGLEQDLRKRTSAQFKRGSLQINLYVKRNGGETQIAVNEAALEQVLNALAKLDGKINVAPATMDGILNIRGIVDAQEPEESEEDRKAREAAIVDSFDLALDQLKTSRRTEGDALGEILSGHIDRVQTLTDDATKTADAQPALLRERLQNQIKELLQAGADLPEDRLAHELAILVTKADVREEIDRLYAHCKAARDLLAEAGPHGRKLDFLTQEFNRESNTLCSKAVDVALTQIGLELKTVVDQMREQVQNLE